MTRYKCPKHGFQICTMLCYHLGKAVGSKTRLDAFVAVDRWRDFHFLCRGCFTIVEKTDPAALLADPYPFIVDVNGYFLLDPGTITIACPECLDEWLQAGNLDSFTLVEEARQKVGLSPLPPPTLP